MKITIISISIIVVFIIFYLIKKYLNILKQQRLNPIIIKKSKNSKKEEIIDASDIPGQGINNQYGITLWLWLDDWNYKKGEWKHILHKGDIEAKRTQPGMWIHPKTNKLSIFFDTEELSIDSMNPTVNYIEKGKQNNYEIIIDNFPIGRWFHIAFVANDTSVYVYLDGLLKKTLPIINTTLKFNEEDLYINQHGGFSGIITQLKYYTIPLPHKKIVEIYSKGPQPWELPDLRNIFFSKKKEKKKREFNPLSAINNEKDINENQGSPSGWNWLGSNMVTNNPGPTITTNNDNSPDIINPSNIDPLNKSSEFNNASNEASDSYNNAKITSQQANASINANLNSDDASPDPEGVSEPAPGVRGATEPVPDPRGGTDPTPDHRGATVPTSSAIGATNPSPIAIDSAPGPRGATDSEPGLRGITDPSPGPKDATDLAPSVDSEIQIATQLNTGTMSNALGLRPDAAAAAVEAGMTSTKLGIDLANSVGTSRMTPDRTIPALGPRGPTDSEIQMANELNANSLSNALVPASEAAAAAAATVIEAGMTSTKLGNGLPSSSDTSGISLGGTVPALGSRGATNTVPSRDSEIQMATQLNTGTMSNTLGLRPEAAAAAIEAGMTSPKLGDGHPNNGVVSGMSPVTSVVPGGIPSSSSDNTPNPDVLSATALSKTETDPSISDKVTITGNLAPFIDYSRDKIEKFKNYKKKDENRVKKNLGVIKDINSFRQINYLIRR